VLSIKNSYVQRDRAREHIQEPEILCAEVCEAERNATKLEVKKEIDLPAKHTDIYAAERGNTPIPERCSVITGETLICLRA
jgi:hypothetical protein